MSASRRRRYDPIAMAATETSIWDVYNNAADIRDDELIKDWKDSLNFLLVFAAIFAAVLAALIVESMKMLQPDTQDLAASILLHMSKQLANNTLPPFEPESFETPRYAVIVNALFFTSLCCSLIAALAGVIALQWVNEYDAHLETVDVRKYALVRHFRYIGVEKWKMGEIIAILPMLLHASVFLFFAGIVAWLKNRHLTIFYICVGGAAVAATFYTVTAILRFFGSAPFRSPVGNAARYLILYSVAGIVIALCFTAYVTLLAAFGLVFWPLMCFSKPNSASRLANHLWTFIIEKSLPFLTESLIPWLRRLASDIDASEDNPLLELQLAMWTATHVGISQQSLHRLVHILGHVHTSLARGNVLPGVWETALDQIIKSYLQDSINRNPSDLDSPSIIIFVNTWTSFGHQTWSKQMFDEVRTRSWDDWSPLMKLIGPLNFEGTLTETEMTIVVKLIQINAFKTGLPSRQLLEDISAVLGNPGAIIGPHITRYAISMLSVYLWRSEENDMSQRVAEVLIHLVTIPPTRPNTPVLPETELSLVYSALYAVVGVFDRERQRRFWASKHRFVNFVELGNRLSAVQALNTAIASQHAAAASQENNSPTELRKHLRRLCRILAYTPTPNPSRGFIQRAESILMQNPHYLDDPSQVWLSNLRGSAALPTLIWTSKLHSTPRVHYYLTLFLDSRRQARYLIPLWREWDIHWPTEFREDDIPWVSQCQQDRGLVEIMTAFDQLVMNGLTPREHATLISLIVDDLSLDTGTLYDGYYTHERQVKLMALRDPALRLVAASATDVPYSETASSVGHDIWNQEAGMIAAGYWWRKYDGSFSSENDAPLRAILSTPDQSVSAFVIAASNRDQGLQDRIRAILRSSLSENSADAALLHINAYKAVWFTEYLAPGTHIIQILHSPSLSHYFSHPRLLSLLSALLPFVDDYDRLEAISLFTSTRLWEDGGYSDQSIIEPFLAAFEPIFHARWLREIQNVDEDHHRAVMCQMNYIILTGRAQMHGPISILRTGERASASLRYPVQYEGQRYSCAASWDL